QRGYTKCEHSDLHQLAYYMKRVRSTTASTSASRPNTATKPSSTPIVNDHWGGPAPTQPYFSGTTVTTPVPNSATRGGPGRTSAAATIRSPARNRRSSVASSPALA